MNALAIDWSGPSRQGCPLCAKARCKAVSVTSRPDGGIAHCHRCGSSWYEKPARNGLLCVIAPPPTHAHARDGGEQHREVAATARAIWERARPADEAHSYLARKQSRPHDARIDAEGRLLVPMMLDGELVNLQRISGDGTKRFLAGGRTRGACYPMVDLSIDVGAVFVAEGFATASTVHEATALPVVVAFSAGNLLAAAAAARRMFPQDVLVIAADNDAMGERNPGLDAARAVGNELGCAIVAPGESGDWNDMRTRYGWRGVVAFLNGAVEKARAL